MRGSIFRTCVILALLSFVVARCVAQEVRTDSDDDALHALLRTNSLKRTGRQAIDNKVLNQIAKSIIKGNAVAKTLGRKKIISLLRRIIKLGSCNIRVCFALDGSASISKQEYELQKELVSIIAAITSLDDEGEYSAVQYGLVNANIYPKIDNRINRFLRAVRRSKSQKAPNTFLAAGLGFCIGSTLGATPGGKQAIVVLGDGRSNFGDGSLDLVLSTITTQEVWAVGVGFPQSPSLLTEIATDNSKVFSLRRYSDFSKVVRKLVLGLCRKK